MIAGRVATAVVEEPAGLAPWLQEWDALAVQMRRPLVSPGWMLAWWEHAAPRNALLRVVVVTEGGRLLGLAPYFASRSGLRVDYRLLGSGSSHRITPLADPARKPEVAEAVADALASADPRPDLITLEGTDADSPWHELLRRSPKHRRLAPRYTTSLHSAPVVTLPAAGFQAWLATRSKNFRKQLRRAQRELEAAGGSVRLATTPAELERAGHALLEFHHHRWRHRGGTNLADTAPQLLRAAAAHLELPERLRVVLVEVGGKLVAVEVLLAAGGEITSWNGGFASDSAHRSLSLVALAAAIEDGCERGDARLDLGAGAGDYKWRLADTDAPIRWGGVMPRGPRLPLTYLSMVPQQTRHRLKRLVHGMPEPVETMVRGAYRGRRLAAAGAVATAAALAFLE